MNTLPRYHQFEELFNVMKGMHSFALLAPERLPVSYDGLYNQIEKVMSFLNNHGLGRGSRIAAILPNGPDMAALFLGVIAESVFVPLAPSLTEEGYASSFSNLKVSALVVTSDSNLCARSVAVQNNIPVIKLMPLKDEAAGLFDLTWKSGDKQRPVHRGFPSPEDIAVILVTSGTSSQPKVVPLRQKNIFAAAWHIASTLELTAKDRCLNMMPMFHITGLVSPILASLLAGGSVFCPAELSLNDFEAWLRHYSPTWYSAVPAIHQAILDKADQTGWDLRNTSLRFVRSTTSPLFEPLFLRLERLFGVPVIQSYGLTEALPISSTPLNPYRRRPTSVGVPISDIRIVDDRGLQLECGATGEILVSGPQVFNGYENYPKANESVFSDGWFRTGDIGYLDEENYLYVTGRLKEMINRGGQKVSPSEVETVLMTHAAVREVAVFGVPHDRLGEAVIAAVVLTDKSRTSEADLQRHVAEHLAPYSVPQQIITVANIPKGSSGKFRRSDLAQHFRDSLNPVFSNPVTETEKTIAMIWSSILKIETVGRNDNFFSLGGDSLMAVEMFAHIEKVLGVVLPSAVIYQAPTVERLAEEIERQRLREAPSFLVPLRKEGSRFPLICVPPVTGEVLVYHQLLKYIDLDQPVYALTSSEVVLQQSMEETAARYLAEILRKTRYKAFLLLGFSSGGLMAFEIARQLHLEGRTVPFLGVIDTSCLPYVAEELHRSSLARIADFMKNLPYWLYYYLPFWLRHYRKLVTDRMKVTFRSKMLGGEGLVHELIDQSPKVLDWLHRYVPQRFPAHITFYRAKAQGLVLSFPDMGWGCLVDTVRVRPVPGIHGDIVREPFVKSLAEDINEDLRAIIT